MSSSETLFLKASREAYRYDSIKGALTTEQLWSLPLTSKTAFDLDSVAVEVNRQLRSLAEESFVETGTDPRRSELSTKLEILKAIIAIRKEENQARVDAEKRADLRRKIQEAIENKQQEQLSSSSLEDLQAQLAALS